MMGKNGWSKTKLCPFSLGVGIGAAEGIYLFIFALAAKLGGYGVPLIEQIGHTFYGYAPTYIGAFIGGAWGFVDGFIFGLIVGFFYNLCMCCRCKKCDDKVENK